VAALEARRIPLAGLRQLGEGEPVRERIAGPPARVPGQQLEAARGSLAGGDAVHHEHRSLDDVHGERRERQVVHPLLK
jgi:hypothetical protein